MKKIIISAALIAAFPVNALFAHEWFAAPLDAKNYKSGDTFVLGVYSTHHFMVGEGVQDASRNAIYVLQDNKPVDTKVTVSRNEAQKILTAGFDIPQGAPVMVLVNSVGSFLNTTLAGPRGGTKETLKALGFSVLKTTLREGWVKIYVNPSLDDKTYAQALGLPLEIVPVTNPAGIAAGKSAVFNVLLNGKPLPNAKINATYKSYNSKDTEAWAIKDAAADKAGQITLEIPAASGAKDVWVLKAAYSGDVKTPASDAVAYSCWISFVVQK